MKRQGVDALPQVRVWTYLSDGLSGIRPKLLP